MVWHFEDSVTVWFATCMGSTFWRSAVFVFRPNCGGNVSVWDIGTCVEAMCLSETSVHVHQPTFLGAFARLLKATVTLVVSLHLSVCLHVTNRLPQNVMLEYFLGICQANWNFIWIWEEWWVLHMNSSINVQSYLCQFFLQWEIFHTKVV